MGRAVLALVGGCFFLVILLPAFLIGIFGGRPTRTLPSPEGLTLRVQVGREVVRLGLEEYVRGVVAAEMPPSFELEALKAQAVAARTYAYYRLLHQGEARTDEEAQISTDYRQDQAWISEAEFRRRFGIASLLLWPKVTRAVQETAGEILTYNGAPVNAVYHSTCGGRTEDAAAVWQTPLPYLVSVPCPYCRDSPRYRETREFSLRDLETATGIKLNSLQVSAGKQKGVLEVLARTGSGRVARVKVGDRVLAGTQLRSLLGLRSTHFTCQWEGTRLRITTRGYGHGVGLCQYGANGLAKAGKSYRDILTYYYRGVQSHRLPEKTIFE